MYGTQTLPAVPTNLLLVEDDEVDATWAARSLSGSPFNIEHVDTLEQALSRLSTETVELVLLDLALPDADGVSSIERIHATNPHLPIIVYSGSSYDSHGLLALEKGALYFYPKALSDGERLARAVQQALDRFRTEENLRRVIAASPDAMAVFSPDRRLEFWNPAAQSLLGIDPRTASDYRFPRPLETGELPELKLHSGTTVDVQVTDLQWNGQPALLATLYDTSERRRQPPQSHQAQRLEAMGLLASGVAQGFNNTFTAINGLTDLALHHLARPTLIKENLLQIKTEIGRDSAFIRRLLTFSRGDAFEPRLIDLDSVVSNVNGKLFLLIGEDIELVLSRASGDHRINADPDQIEQIIINLVINARDAMPAGGTLTIETYDVYLGRDFNNRYMAAPPGDYVALSVTDTGIGMDDETMDHIFEPFFSTRRDHPGTGLGLATVYGIVKQHGGTIKVISEPGHGSSFKIFLPCVNTSAETSDG